MFLSSAKDILPRISMPLKAVCGGLLCGLFIWILLDYLENLALQHILTKQLSEHLQEEAAADRIHFDHHIKQHVRATNLLAVNQQLVLWLDHLNNTEQPHEMRQIRKTSPPWFPPISAWRGLIDPRYILLRDNQGRVQEVYQLRDRELPDTFFTDNLLMMRSQNHARLTVQDGTPYLLTSAPVADTQGQIQGFLTIVTVLDNQFLTKLHYGTVRSGAILALLEGTEKLRVVASSDPSHVQPGIMLDDMFEDYLITKEPFFDDGASDLRLQLTTLMPKTSLAELNESVLTLGRKEHVVAAVVFVSIFTLIIYLLSRRIDRLVRIITVFAQRTLGSKHTLPRGGDELAHLEQRIDLLTGEVVSATDAMRLRYEMEQKAKQLQVLEAVTQELEEGVLYLNDDGEERTSNQQMSEFETEYGKEFCSPEKIGQHGEVTLLDRRHRRHILRVRQLTLNELGRVTLVRDVSEQTLAEKILTESDERYRSITQSATDAIVSIDVAGTVVSWNSEATRLFGYSESEIIGTPLERLMPQTYRAAHRAGIDQVCAGRRSFVSGKPLEMEGLRKDGTCFPMELAISTWTMQGAQYFTGIVRDITARRQAERTTRAERQLLEQIIDNVPHSIFWKDRDSVYLGCNRNFAKECGFKSPQDIIGKTDYDLASKKEQADLFRKADKHILSSGESELWIEESRLRADGSEVTVLTSKVPLRDPSNAIIGVLGIYADITDRKQAEEALSEREAQLRLILASTREGIFGVDTAGKCTFANRACLQLLGYQDESDLYGKNMHELIHLSRADGSTYPVEESPTYQACSRKKGLLTEDTVFWRADGHSFPAKCYSHPIIKDGKVLGAVVTFSDITERKRAEAALRSERDCAESLIVTAQAIVLVLDPEGRIVRFNPFMEQLSGYRLEEVLGKGWFTTFLPECEQAQAQEAFSLAVAGNQTSRHIGNILTHSGRQRTIEWNNKILEGADGQPIGMLAIGHDITDRKENEAQLLQAQKMEVVGQLTGGIAHDFNNLLTIIMGNLNALAKEIGAGDDPDIRDELDDALSAAQDGAHLTQRLLALSRKQALEPRRIDLNRIVSELGRFLRRLLGGHIKLRINRAEETAMVFADPSQLEGALLNLAINARDAMPQGGALTIDVTHQHINTDATTSFGLQAGKYFIASITDSGIGMSPEDLSRAVEPFFTTKDPGKGTGLGLSMVYNFAKQSGGDLRLKSNVGQGTTASVILPEAASTREGEVRKEHEKDIPRGSEAILVVEDEPRLRKFTRRRLTRLGYRILEAKTAAEAEAILGAGTPVNLLFSDVVMPGKMNGYDLARWAVTTRPALRVLLATGATGQISAEDEEPINKGEFPLLRKPYTEQTLARTIRDLLDQ
jgi:PAS domain S-box-containing protein